MLLLRWFPINIEPTNKTQYREEISLMKIKKLFYGGKSKALSFSYGNGVFQNL